MMSVTDRRTDRRLDDGWDAKCILLSRVKIQFSEDTGGIIKEKVCMSKTKIWKAESTDERYETDGLKYARTEENVTIVDELVDKLWQEGQKQARCSTRRYQKRRSEHNAASYGSFTTFLVWSFFRLLKRLLPIIIGFLYVYISPPWPCYVTCLNICPHPLAPARLTPLSSATLNIVWLAECWQTGGIELIE